MYTMQQMATKPTPRQKLQKTTMQIELARNPRQTTGPSTKILPRPRASAEKRRPVRGFCARKTKTPPSLHFVPVDRALHASLVPSSAPPSLSLLSTAFVFARKKYPKRPCANPSSCPPTKLLSPPRRLYVGLLASVSSPKIPVFFALRLFRPRGWFHSTVLFEPVRGNGNAGGRDRGSKVRPCSPTSCGNLRLLGRHSAAWFKGLGL